MKPPKSALGRRRLTLLRVLAAAGGAPLTTPALALRCRWTLQTTRKRLADLEALGVACRLSYRTWSATIFPLPRGFDATILDKDPSCSS